MCSGCCGGEARHGELLGPRDHRRVPARSRAIRTRVRRLREAGDGQTPHAHLATTRAQARLLLRQTPDARRRSSIPLLRCPACWLFTGHRIDAGAGVPRFPAQLAPAIKERIRQVVARSRAGFGYAAAANGRIFFSSKPCRKPGWKLTCICRCPRRNSSGRAWVTRPAGWSGIAQ